jgi:PIN domain nuclease of toxin-antitoxin system
MKDKKLKKEQAEADNLIEAAKDSEEVVEFDIYFQVLLKDRLVQSHHKPAMRLYAEQAGKLNATKSEFEKLFKSY